MLRISIERRNGAYKKIACSGHIGYARKGKDIVCAGASAIVLNTINSIEALTSQDMAVKSAPKGGKLLAVFKGKTDERAELLIDSMILGLSGIIEEYGSKYLSLHIKEV